MKADDSGNDSNNADAQSQDGNSDIYESDDPELGLEDRDLEGWDDVESDGSDGKDGDEEIEEEDFTGM